MSVLLQVLKNILDFSPLFGSINAVLLRQGRWPVTPAGGARAVPAGRGSSPPLPGGFGKTPGRHDDRPAKSWLDWDRRGRVTPAS